ncbi:SDR family oxidoreductase [Pseudomonas sp. R2.Fl]|nr:SDR family oxidoreductase [Pseudomonas sp. R2.Fl]
MELVNTFELSGRRAIVTGGAGHLGRAISRGLAAAGAAVHLVGRNVEKLKAVATELGNEGYEISFEAVNLSDAAAIEQFADRFIASNGALDILVNNAYSGVTNSLENSTADQFRDSYNIGMVAAAELIRTLLPALRAAVSLRKDASVINIASMYGHVSPDPRIYGDSGQNSPPFYGALKGALIQYTRYAACHLAKDGIRVNAISPGPFPPASFRETKPEFYKQLVSKVPLSRLGAAEDLVGPVVFLASPSARFVTGVNLPVDGGWTAW